VAEIPEQNDSLRGKLSVGQLDIILRRLESLPTLPAVAERLLELTGEVFKGGSAVGDSEQLRELIDLIGSDQSLTARLLSLANRSSPEPLKTVGEAVEKLGFQTVRSVALSVKVFQTFGRAGAGDSGLDRPGFWRHCLAVAAAAEMLARRLDVQIEPGEAFVCGLLHDLGKLALEQCFPKSYRRVPEAVRTHGGDIADFERRFIGVDHSIAGRRLGQHWRLPETLQEVIWLHHQPIEAIPPAVSSGKLLGLVSLADTIARQGRFGFSGNCTFRRTAEQLAERLGISAAVLEEVTAGLPEKIRHRAELFGLERRGGESFYREALSGANAELARLNEQLQRRAEGFSAQARAFKHLRDFAAALRPEATVPDALIRIAEMMASARGIVPAASQPVVTYSVDEADDVLLAMRCDGSDTPAWRRLPLVPGFVATGPDTSAAPAAEALASLLAEPGDLNDWLDVSAYTHQPLVCSARWVGGVLYPPRPQTTPEPGGAEDLCEALAAAVALALAIVQGRCRAVLISEQLTRASQVLAATQDALAEAKMLSAVGEMAAGAGHEINTPLAVIVGRAQLMQEKAGTEKERQTWQLIAEQAQRISEIISNLMEVANPLSPAAERLDVAALLKGAVSAFSSSDHPQAAEARVDIEIGRNTPPIMADKAQMQAVVLELITNAATAAVAAPQIRLAAEADEANGAVMLTVRDNGPGMDRQTAERAFTPFFSSQPAGRRHGMGLPQARRYVENNGGRIWIRTTPGEGATVYLQLPAGK